MDFSRKIAEKWVDLDVRFFSAGGDACAPGHKFIGSFYRLFAFLLPSFFVIDG